MDVEPQLPPPSYAEAATEASTGSTTVAGSEPPTYTETISRIRKQLPKLSRSISVSAQKVGRQMSIKRNNPDSVVEAPMDLEGSVVTGGGSMKTKKKSPPPLIRWQS